MSGQRDTLLLDNMVNQQTRSRAKLVLVVMFFCISLVAFVCQTETTSYVYSLRFQFNEPYLLLFLTHGSWLFLWPVQLVGVSLWRSYFEFSKTRGYSRLSGGTEDVDEQHSFQKHVTIQIQWVYRISELIYNTAKQLPPGTRHIEQLDFEDISLATLYGLEVMRYICKVSFVNTAIITVASLTWYVAMRYSPLNDVTAIYNCSAFFAYLFAIPLLRERFSWLKLSSVVIAVCGVFLVVYSGSAGSAGSAAKSTEEKHHSFFGNILISVGSISYGYYDVFYKKYLCPPQLSGHYAVSAKRQALYSNFICSLVGGASSVILLVLLVILHITGIKPLHWHFSPATWFYIAVSVLANILYSASMLVLYALTSPVLGAVSSLTTIFLVGLFEWICFGNKLNGIQIFGDIVVIIGFSVLSIAYWQEIIQDQEDA